LISCSGMSQGFFHCIFNGAGDPEAAKLRRSAKVVYACNGPGGLGRLADQRGIDLFTGYDLLRRRGPHRNTGRGCRAHRNCNVIDRTALRQCNADTGIDDGQIGRGALKFAKPTAAVVLRLRYLDLDADVEEGDRVVTAGLGDAVPKGLPVAVVTRVERDALRGTAQAAAKPTADLGRLEEVLCLLD